MNLTKAIDVAKNHVKWQKDGVPVPYEQLNSELLCQALKLLIDNAELTLKEVDAWTSK